MINNQHQVDYESDQTPEFLPSINKALKKLISFAKVMDSTQLIELDDALHRILAVDIHANISVPSFDNSAMDGYAINLKKNQINTPGKFVFEITDRISAGNTGSILEPGCAARIFTGAPIPNGANTVLVQEECKVVKNKLIIKVDRPILLNENIRPIGNDIQSGDVILFKGKQLQPQDIAIASSIGIRKFKVFNKIKVGVFFTGDELVQPGNTLQQGQIFNSNRYLLVALLNKLSCDIINLGNIKDTLNATCDALETLKSDCDLIITTGGVSIGDKDYIKPAIEKLGQLNLWRIKIKPGKPIAFGNIGHCTFIGLPGNPVSTMVTFLLFARPFIKKIQGANHYLNTTLKIKANFDWHKPKPRCEFVRVCLDRTTFPAKANIYTKQGSNVLSSMVWADGLMEIPEKTTFKKGEILNFYSLNEMLS